jgi:hypothetical protein
MARLRSLARRVIGAHHAGAAGAIRAQQRGVDEARVVFDNAVDDADVAAVDGAAGEDLAGS